MANAENTVSPPGGAYTEKIKSFGDLKVGDVVAVLNNGYDISDRQGDPRYTTGYYNGTISAIDNTGIIFKGPDVVDLNGKKDKNGNRPKKAGTTFRIEKKESLLIQPNDQQGYVRIYRDPVASQAAQEAARKAQEAAALKAQEAAAPATTETPAPAPVVGGRSKRRTRRKKRTRRHRKAKKSSRNV